MASLTVARDIASLGADVRAAALDAPGLLERSRVARTLRAQASPRAATVEIEEIGRNVLGQRCALRGSKLLVLDDGHWRQAHGLREHMTLGI
jgi:hypothetical protein